MNEKHRGYDATQWNADLRILSPRVVQSAQGPGEEATQSDIDSFLSSYGETLRETLPAEHMPTALTTDYVFESCIRKDPEGKRDLPAAPTVGWGAGAATYNQGLPRGRCA